MTVRIYKSTDASAPVLSGTAGALIALLDAVLVGTAGIAYGSTASAGWTKEYSGTNLAAYRPPVGGNRFYLRIDDTGTTNGRAVGYETMSGISAGVNAFSTEAQFSGGMYWPKSNTADATARPWIIAATDRMLYMHVSSLSTANAVDASMCAFGDIKSYKAGDAYGTIHIGAGTATTTSSNSMYIETVNVGTGASVGHYLARSYPQIGGSVQVGKHTDCAKGAGQTTMGSVGLPYPHGPDGGLYYAPVWIHEPSGGPSVRGVLPGIWAPLHDRPLQHLDTFAGSGAHAGRTFLALKMYSQSECFLETSDTWDV